jgi:hypothetical protein
LNSESALHLFEKLCVTFSDRWWSVTSSTLFGKHQARIQKFSEGGPNFLGGAHHGGNFFYAARKLSTCTPLQGFFWLRGGLGPMGPPFGTCLINNLFCCSVKNDLIYRQNYVLMHIIISFLDKSLKSLIIIHRCN